MAGDRYSELGPMFGHGTIGVSGCLLDWVTQVSPFPVFAAVCGVHRCRGQVAVAPPSCLGF